MFCNHNVYFALFCRELEISSLDVAKDYSLPNLRSADTMRLVPATSRRDQSQGLVATCELATSRRDQSHRVNCFKI